MITWTLEAPEPGRHGARPPRVAEIGPVRLEVVAVVDGGRGAQLRFPMAGRTEALEGPAWDTLGEAIERAEPWARAELERWRDLGELARAALAAMDGEP